MQSLRLLQMQDSVAHLLVMYGAHLLVTYGAHLLVMYGAHLQHVRREIYTGHGIRSETPAIQVSVRVYVCVCVCVCVWVGGCIFE